RHPWQTAAGKRSRRRAPGGATERAIQSARPAGVAPTVGITSRRPAAPGGRCNCGRAVQGLLAARAAGLPRAVTMTDPTNGAPPTDRPSLLPRSRCLGEEIVPLRSGSVHYSRLSPSDWPRALRAVRRLRRSLIDVAVPWSVHESTRGVFDFGEGDRRLDLRRFIELCGEHGLRCLLHPGPAVGAELTCLGIPERVVWDPRCQARSPSGKPLVLP